MPIITATQLRSLLGVSVSLYSDEYLDEIIATAENNVLPLLVSPTSSIEKFQLKDNVAKFFTPRPHYFVTGQSVVISGLTATFNGTYTVVSKGEYWFTVAKTAADVTLRTAIPNGRATLQGYSAEEIYADDPDAISAVYAVATDVFQSRKAAGGQIESIDGTISPYRMGRGLFGRVIGILGSKLDVEAMVD